MPECLCGQRVPSTTGPPQRLQPVVPEKDSTSDESWDGRCSEAPPQRTHLRRREVQSRRPQHAPAVHSRFPCMGPIHGRFTACPSACAPLPGKCLTPIRPVHLQHGTYSRQVHSMSRGLFIHKHGTYSRQVHNMSRGLCALPAPALPAEAALMLPAPLPWLPSLSLCSPIPAGDAELSAVPVGGISSPSPSLEGME